MKRIIFAFLFLLCGCASETVVNHVAQDVRDDLTLIAEDVYALPPECGDQTMLAQRIELARSRIDILEETYEAEASDLRSKNRRLSFINDTLVAIMILAAVLMAKYFLKKV